MPLLTASYYQELFEDLCERSVGFVALAGNAGDLMIQQATRELFDAFNIKYYQVTESELLSGILNQAVDEIVVSGGGNMGKLWPIPYEQRQRALGFGLPVTIFPQSFTRNDEDTSSYKRVFVRESASQQYDKNFILAPEMALGIDVQATSAQPVVETGLFLRKDVESKIKNDAISFLDPVLVSKTIEDYLGLASMFEHIITDRLHFAIAGLMVGSKVTMLPNSYHKNRSVYETWLQDLGCLWLDDAGSISYDRAQAEPLVWKRLGGIPSEIMEWSMKPVAKQQYLSNKNFDIEPYLESCESYEDFDLYKPGLLESLCDGERTIEEIIMIVNHHFPGRLVSAALDVQKAVRKCIDQELV